jgi:recombination associated protein RdgC
MPLLSGAMGARRYQVLLQPDPPPRERWLEALAEKAFREPPSAAKAGENHGWVSLHNLCITEFEHEDCFYNQYLCFSLRMDRKAIPAKLLRALLDLRMRDWMAEMNREKVPAAVKRELKEQLELELLPRQLPSVAAHDVAWDTARGVVWFFNSGNKANEVFRILFGQTFDLETRPIGALQLIADNKEADQWVPKLDSIGHSDYRPEVPR